ncbi:MAG: glycoside hydrolase, partial [Thermoleophilia bacterium]|nr:glycoside hydrolase [Thermoleophilia bacterium]
PRARNHPRYLELARKREAHLAEGWEKCAAAFTVEELRDLQVWFNLAWFDPSVLEEDPLRELVQRGRDFTEADKEILAAAQRDLLARVLPAYRQAWRRGQIEISTSPYYHPILPLLINTDSARIGAPDLVLPRYRFAHPEDAREQIRLALEKHEQVFGHRPQGMWCSEQAVGEDVVALLIEAGLKWTISDETVLQRSLAGISRDPLPPLSSQELDRPYLLEREQGEIAIVFRDHSLSDLIGFTYHAWNSREAAADLLHRLRERRDVLLAKTSSA